MTFPSKVDAWILWLPRLIYLVTAVALAVAMTRDGVPIPAVLLPVVIIAATAIITEWTFATTRYTIEGGTLHVRSGMFSWRIPIREIESVKPTRNPLSSPALSLDRLAIRYSGGKTVMISPLERERFLQALRSVHSGIEISG